MGNCCKSYANQDSEGDSSEMLVVYNLGSPRERLVSYGDESSREMSCKEALSELDAESSTSNKGEGRSGIRDHQFVYHVQHPGSGGIPKARHGEQVAAGWPAWLSEVADEAIQGWIPRQLDSFTRLDKIGQGTFGDVYRARDLEEGRMVALKKVKFDSLDRDSIRFMAREICILRRLRHPNVIRLEGLVTSRMSCTIYLVFEYMEHDLTGLLARPDLKFTEPQIKCYMKQLLHGLDYCHRRGILHRDIKSSNLLIGKNGILKIADFGLSTVYHQPQVEPMTNRVVTLWYRPPELLLGATFYGTAVDLWSAGCVLAELYAGKPIMTGRTELEQLFEIFKLCGSPSEEYWKMSDLPQAASFKSRRPHRRCIAERFKDFPTPALAFVETLLSLDPVARSSAAHALNNEFFTSKPLPCKPEDLPKYPSSRVMDARVRAEEAQREAESKSIGKRYDDEGERTVESRPIRAPNADAKSIHSMKIKANQSNFRSENFNPLQEGVASQLDAKYHEEWMDKYGSLQLEAINALRKPGSYHSGPPLAPTSNVNQMSRVQREAIHLPTTSLQDGPSHRLKK